MPDENLPPPGCASAATGGTKPLAIDSSMMMPNGPSPPVPISSDAPRFHAERHVKYWLRCFSTPLPHQYQANDASLLSLTFFTLSALDLLGALESRITPEDRTARIDAIYACQHPDGGFRGFRGTDLGSRRTEVNKVWDPANLPACYFALGSLLILGDDLSRVDKTGCLALLRRLQRSTDGSFGEYLGHDGVSVMGGTDTRYGYCAMAVRWILRGSDPNLRGKPAHGGADVDVEGLVACIRSSATYDGGLSEQSSHEAHAGFTYCAIAALELAGNLTDDVNSDNSGLQDRMSVVEWLLARLTTQIEEEELENEDRESSHGYFDDVKSQMGDRTVLDAPPSPTVKPISGDPVSKPGTIGTFEKLRSLPQSHLPSRSSPPPEDSTSAHVTPLAQALLPPNYAAGFSGRINKPADTCYAFWAGASLALLATPSLPLNGLLDVKPIEDYLLGHTQHSIAGGFGKFPGDPPDIYHSYMGLAALSVLSSQESDSKGPPVTAFPIRKLDPTLCLSMRAREWCEQLPWRRALLSGS